MQLLQSSVVDFMRVIMFTDCVQVGLHGDIHLHVYSMVVDR
jgi:hypothetical protein